ncbi:MAG: HPP family protein, partial [Planctomycetota bacterium]
PLAARGLERAGISTEDASRFLDVLNERVASGQTGSQWMLEGFNRMRAFVPEDEALQGLTRAYVARQRTRQPVHTWEGAAPPDRERRRAAYERIGQVMRRDLQTVQAEDAIGLAEAMMRWEGIQHVPVENERGELVGIVTVRDLLGALRDGKTDRSVRVGEIMDRNIKTVSPETPTLEVIRQMRDETIGCVAVVREGKLVGLASAADFLTVAARLLE